MDLVWFELDPVLCDSWTLEQGVTLASLCDDKEQLLQRCASDSLLKALHTWELPVPSASCELHSTIATGTGTAWVSKQEFSLESTRFFYSNVKAIFKD